MDKYLLGWKGRTVLIPLKSTQLGITMCKVYESSIGYVQKCVMYIGATTQYCDKFMHEPPTYRVVELLEPPLYKKYTVYLESSQDQS